MIKKFFKYTLIFFAAIFTVAIFMTACSSDDATKKEEPATTEKATETKEPAVKKEEPKKAAPKKKTNGPEITKAEFAKIKNGMTYDEVVKIIGSKGEMNSETGAEGDDLYTVMYTWKGNSLGSNANAMFQGNPATLQTKAQFGLK